MATARVEELLPVGETFPVVSKAYGSRGKFGRPMMDFALPNGRMLCEVLLEERLAVPYNGENKATIRSLHEANWHALEEAK